MDQFKKNVISSFENVKNDILSVHNELAEIKKGYQAVLHELKLLKDKNLNVIKSNQNMNKKLLNYSKEVSTLKKENKLFLKKLESLTKKFEKLKIKKNK